MNLKICSWNINSVRLRLDLVGDLIAQHQPDILCLQETKCEDANFPRDFFVQNGLPHSLHLGQKSYNGVAILSKHPLNPLPDLIAHNSARYIAAQISGFEIEVHNFYVPAGGDIPDAQLNEKFADKLDFLGRMRAAAQANSNHRSIWLGDFNIAPHEHDVWSHKQLLDVVSHTPIEVEQLLTLQSEGKFTDCAREFVPMGEKSYSWWSYRNRDWQKSNRGRRLDHIWVGDGLKENLHSYHSLIDARSWQRPSDHVPILVELSDI